MTSPMQPGQPYQQPYSQQPQPPQLPYGHPEPSGNHLGMQSAPPMGQAPQQVAPGDEMSTEPEQPARDHTWLVVLVFAVVVVGSAFLVFFVIR